MRLLTGLILLTAFFFSCSKKENVILIGEYGSLTGNTATFGQSTHQGIMLATEEINQSGGILGKPVKIITEDDQSKPEEARNAVLKLIQQDKVVAVLGEVASSRSLAGAPECQRSRIPMISPASTNPKVTEVGDYIFRICFIDPFQGESMAKFAYQNLNFRKIAVLTDIKNDYSVGLSQFFVNTFTSLGGTIIKKESYSEGDVDFRAQMTSLKAEKPEAIFLPGYYTEVGLICRQARELGYQGPFLGGDGWDSDKTIEIGGTAVEGAYFSNHYSADVQDSKVRNFIEKFQSRYGKTADAMAVLGYDAAMILFDAIRRAATTDGPVVRDALSQTKNFLGVSGTITLDEKRNAKKDLVVMKIENGEFKYHQTVSPD